MDALGCSGYETVPVGINRNGEWFLIRADMSGIRDLDDPRMPGLIPDNTAAPHAEPINPGSLKDFADFAFPVLHGPYGEDGTIQGLFEMTGIPYAGCGVTGSAVSMDKILTKDIWKNADLPVGRYCGAMAHDFMADPAGELARIESMTPYPVFVKPANMGSSVGVSTAGCRDELGAAVGKAFLFDKRVIIEEATPGRELEIGVLGNSELEASAVGEIIAENAFYDFEAKYKNGSTKLGIPADIPLGISAEIAELAMRAYKLLDGKGFSRIDCFYDEKKGKIYMNEMNAIPGFTQYSMFPLLWNESGLAYQALIERIISLGYERHNAKNNR